MTSGFASLPSPPYYVVAFSSLRTGGDLGYGAMAEAMGKLAMQQPGCLGFESARSPDGFGITNAYFKDEASILAWKGNLKHMAAQDMGKVRWYQHYELRIARVERAYSGPEGR